MIANSKLPVRIRAATADDMDAMIPVVNAAYEFETFLEGPRTDRQRMSEMMATGEFLVAQDDSGRVLASVYTEVHGERGYFGMLAVDPARQGTGLGSLLIKAAENHCRRRGCRWMDIVVLNLRSELLPFYRKLGYAETRTEEFRPARPLKDGVECFSIILSKVL
ncbi:MAG: GNAT family N-acetyltransferase [Acidobacteriota bacterium]